VEVARPVLPAAAGDGVVKDTVSSEAVETFQVMYDNLPESTGTAERLLEGFDA